MSKYKELQIRRPENTRSFKLEDQKIQGASKTRKRGDDRAGFILEDPQDGIIEALNFADTDVFPNIRKLLILGATSPIESSKAERAASGIRRIKPPYRVTMGDKRESDLNLLNLQRISNIDIQVSLRYLSESIPEKCLRNLYYSKLTVVDSKRTNV